MRRVVHLFCIFVLCFAGRALPGPQNKVTVEFFFEPGCEECARVRREVLPQLEALHDGEYDLVERDMNVESNYLALVAWMDRTGYTGNDYVYMVIDGREFLAGYERIAHELLSRVADRLAAPREAEPAPRPPVDGRAAARERLRRFTVWGVLAWGLIDGLNPCAFSTLVFFISLLSVSRIRGRRLLLAGVAFCIASFATYYAIGFGILSAVHALWGFRILQRTVNAAMLATLLAFALLSFRDALRFAHSGNAHAITLQLPDRLKRLTHRVMRAELQPRHLLISGLVIGAAVTLLESVCTGQAYVPTMVYVVKSGEAVTRGLFYLLLYNLAFVTPLVVVFALTLWGLSFDTLLAWSRRNVVISKILLGVFFLMMAALLLRL